LQDLQGNPGRRRQSFRGENHIERRFGRVGHVESSWLSQVMDNIAIPSGNAAGAGERS